MSPGKARGLCLGMLGIALCACGRAPAVLFAGAAADHNAVIRQEIRPTDGTGWNNNGFGMPAEVYDPPGNHFRVYYVTSGENAVDLTDEAPKNGVPDFVEQVGAAAEETYQSTVVRRGFRPPLDDSIYHDRPKDYGGDGRFDIYLRWAGTGSDGYRVTEACTDGTGGTPGRCAGYFVMNPSYKDWHYPSELDGIRVLTSHELFHTVQDAYNHAQWRTWSEGSAVWNELQVFPNSKATFADYLGFLGAFFQAPERPLDKSMGTGGAASYAYGSAVWAEFLSERFGPAIIREIWEGCEQSPAGEVPHFLSATDTVLRKGYGTTLAQAFTEFTRWNLYTAERAKADFGYKRADAYPGVRMEPDFLVPGQTKSIELNGLSARYLRYQPAGSEPALLRITITDPESPSAIAAVAKQQPQRPPSSPIEYPEGPLEVSVAPDESLLVVLTGAIDGARSRMVQVRFERMPMDTAPQTTASGCAFTNMQDRQSHATLIGILLLAGAILQCQRRRHENRHLRTVQ